MGGGASKTNLATFMRDKRDEDGSRKPGPFVTISRQYGCQGYFLGLLLVDMLKDETPKQPWRVYQREILEHLSDETELSTEVLNRLRREKPRLLADFFRNLSAKKKAPGGYEIRNRIAEIVRALAHQGHCLLVGMGSAGATADMENGLRVRLEAPKEWRTERIVESEGISPVEARLLIQKFDKEREHLAKLYAVRYQREPAFDLVYDCSTFSLGQITQHIIYAMKLKKMI